MLLAMPRAAIKRCTECRGWFRPVASAGTRQCVCGAQCREARRRKLARRRRRRAPGRFRSEERVRQQERRARHSEGGCHAPPSGAKPPDPFKEIHEIVDSALELSRATLQRRLPAILARSGLSKRTKT